MIPQTTDPTQPRADASARANHPSTPVRIARGDAGDAVRDVQSRLRRLWTFGDLVVDGEFGSVTYDAIRRFQRDRGIAADGVVGPQTWRELVEAGWTLGDRLLWRSRVMLRGDDVRELQHRLNQLGFDAGPEDGIFGPLAHEAVEEFQRNVGLAVDGVAGPDTVGALRRLRRDHQSGGIGVRVREREALRRLAGRGLVGARILVDPRHGGHSAGAVGPTGLTEAEISWDLASRLAGRLDASGAYTVLSRGPATNPPATTRARLANEVRVDILVSIGLNSLDNPRAEGTATYYFGAPHFTSETGRRLAECTQNALVAAGWGPDCRSHPMTWPILRETRMPAVVAEPGFLSTPATEQRLRSPATRDTIAAALAHGLEEFFGTESAGDTRPADASAASLTLPA